jgi:hypothetical protein
MKRNRERVRRMKKDQVGWAVSPHIKDAFMGFCDEIGSKYGNELQGALDLWMHMPDAVRAIAKMQAAGTLRIPPEFWRLLGEEIAPRLKVQYEKQKNNDSKKKRP